ncbi:hypothetical protein TNCV_2347091, partial [Trichonephila clavipes]
LNANRFDRWRARGHSVACHRSHACHWFAIPGIEDGNFGMNAVNIQPVLEEEIMDVDGAEPILEDNAAADPILEDNPGAEPILEDNPGAEPILEDNPAADPVLEDNSAADPVMVDNYMEPADGKKEEFYPNKTYALKQLDHEKYAVDYVGNEMLNPFANRYASYSLEKDGVTHKIQFVPRNADGSFNFIKDKDGMVIYPFNLTLNLPIFPQNEEGQDVYFFINSFDHYPRDTKGKPIYVKHQEGHDVPPYSEVNEPMYFYAKDTDGNECYPRDENGDEYYIWRVWTHVPAKRKNGDEYYAKDRLGVDLYPRQLVDYP